MATDEDGLHADRSVGDVRGADGDRHQQILHLARLRHDRTIADGIGPAGTHLDVPLVAREELTYLNASFQPPSNVIIHAAINEFNSQSLLSTR